MRRFVRLTLIGLVLLVAAGFIVDRNYSGSESNKIANPAIVSKSMCTGDGINLTVDFGYRQSNKIIHRCIQNFSGTSWDLLSVSGIKVTGTRKYPVGFVCRLDDFPSAESEMCLDTPDPKVGSWAYFVAQPGQRRWQYSTWGASTHKPKCGSAEQWIFRYPSENLEESPRDRPSTRLCLGG